MKDTFEMRNDLMKNHQVKLILEIDKGEYTKDFIVNTVFMVLDKIGYEMTNLDYVENEGVIRIEATGINENKEIFD